mgnify:CR=1 FL=1
MTHEKRIIDSGNFFRALHKAVENDRLERQRKRKKHAKEVSAKFRQGKNNQKEQGFK